MSMQGIGDNAEKEENLQGDPAHVQEVQDAEISDVQVVQVNIGVNTSVDTLRMGKLQGDPVYEQDLHDTEILIPVIRGLQGDHKSDTKLMMKIQCDPIEEIQGHVIGTRGIESDDVIEDAV